MRCVVAPGGHLFRLARRFGEVEALWMCLLVVVGVLLEKKEVLVRTLQNRGLFFAAWVFIKCLSRERSRSHIERRANDWIGTRDGFV